MQRLITLADQAVQKNNTLPFSIYRSVSEQRLLNVPVIKPLLICVLSGNKMLGNDDQIKCSSGSFIFLSNTPHIAMRNIPNNANYCALLIEFCYSDFASLNPFYANKSTYFQGNIDASLELSLQQFIEWSAFAPEALWHLRRQELLHVLLAMGFEQVRSIMAPPTLSHQVTTLISDHIERDIAAKELASILAMSESSLRRKLSSEGNNLQKLKDSVKLGRALHLVQTSFEPIAHIAEKCGYSSQSRFTDKFKQRFNITPSALRKTTMSDSGE